MARPFSYPEVQQLEVGQACEVDAPLSEVRRKVGLYADRNRKDFMVDSADAVSIAPNGDLADIKVALVTRLPDPEPEVA